MPKPQTADSVSALPARLPQRERASSTDDFESVYRRSWPSVFRVVNRLTGDADVANDITQRAFVRLMERRTMPDDPEAWVVAVANNLRRDYERKRSRRLRIVHRANPTDLPIPKRGVDPDDRLEGDEIQRAVRDALDALPAKSREVLVLRAEGYKYSEIAEITGVAPTSVGQTLSRARAALLKALKRQASCT